MLKSPPERDHDILASSSESHATVFQDPGCANIAPRKGYLVSLRTKGEVLAGTETVAVYVIAIPAKSTNAVLGLLREVLPKDAPNLQHLSRVVKPQFLPPHIRNQAASLYSSRSQSQVEAPNQGGLALADGEAPSSFRVHDIASEDGLFLLVCPTSVISIADLAVALSSQPPFDKGQVPEILTIHVPSHAPTSAEQAKSWSQDYWPVPYKRVNPFGPQPSQIEREQSKMAQEVGYFMALAGRAAQEIKASGIGEPFGCVVVEKQGKEPGHVVAVSGDARWCHSQQTTLGEVRNGPGNVMAHAVMRAIGMVARKRVRSAQEAESRHSDQGSAESATAVGLETLETAWSSSKAFADAPFNVLEKYFFDLSNLTPNGYLCVDLDIYITHEPCLMCSMAILHSRFQRCVFGRRMPMSGGMTADATINGGDRDGLGYGIFWRPAELNWKFFAWEWADDEGEGSEVRIQEDVHV